MIRLISNRLIRIINNRLEQIKIRICFFLRDARNVTTLMIKKVIIKRRIIVSNFSSDYSRRSLTVNHFSQLFCVLHVGILVVFATLRIPFALDEVKIIPLAPSRSDVRFSSRLVASQCRVSAELELKLLLLILICDS